MEQMQMTVLSMMQAVTTQQSGKSAESVSSGEDFRSMMEKQSKEPETKELTTEKAELPKQDELDENAMQELAAMQILAADVMQIVTVESEELNLGVEAVTLAEEMPVLTQQIVAEPAAVAETADGAEQIAAAETMETSEGKPVLQSEVKAEVATDAAAEDTVQVAQSGSAESQRSGAETEQQSEESFVEEVDVAVGEQKVFHDVETAPVKVSETTSETMESVKTQIGDKLNETLAKGETRVELQLNPDHLGKITIELTKGSDGALHVSLFAENSQTRLMLERDMAGLQNLLHQNVREDVQVEVSHGEEAQQHESYEGHQQNSREQQRQERRESEDFLNQLRLGLIPQEETVV